MPELSEDFKTRIADEVALFIVETGLPIDTVINFTAKVARIVCDADIAMVKEIIDERLGEKK